MYSYYNNEFTQKRIGAEKFTKNQKNYYWLMLNNRYST